MQFPSVRLDVFTSELSLALIRITSELLLVLLQFVMAIANPLHGKRKAGTVGEPLPRVEVQ